MITLDKQRIFKMSLAFMKTKGEPDSFLLESMNSAYAELLNTADLRHILIKSGRDIAFLPGDSVKNHLRSCTFYYYFAATAGQAVDVLIKKSQLSAISHAVVIDAMAGAILEDYCDKVCAVLPETATPRFSPGYGDMPLSFQETLLSECSASKLGIKALPSGLLIPSKSITAIIGV